MILVNTVLLIARILMSSLFLWAGMRKICNWNGTQDYMRTKQTKYIKALLPIAVALQMIGGLLLLLGIYVRIGALLLILFTLPATIQMHDFWHLAGKERIAEKAHFLKDLAIIGGLLLFLLLGSGEYSIH